MEKSNYNKELILSLSMVIPCAHIPREFIADRVTKHFVEYLDKSLEAGKSVKDILLDITGEDKYNG
jgi:hypothetical protein